MTKFGDFGETEAELGNNDFFSWAQLERVDEVAGAGETVFRPRGPAFRTLVSFISRADRRRRLSGLRLNVARSFINDPGQGAFARDIVKSFLETVSCAAPALRSLMDEIVFRKPRAPIIMRGTPPPLPLQPSAGFLVFAGEERDCSFDLPGLTLTLANPGNDNLVVRADPKALNEGCLSRLMNRSR